MVGENPQTPGLSEFDRKLLELYAKRYNMTLDQLLQELDRMPGETLSDRLREYVNQRRGLSVEGNLVAVLKYTEYPTAEGTVRYRVPVFVDLSDEMKNYLAEQLGVDVSVFKVPIFTLWFSDKRLVDAINNIPIGNKVLVTGITVSHGDMGGTFLNARNVIDRGPDAQYLESISAKPENIKDVALEENKSIVLDLTGTDVVVDPIETTTTRGTPKVRIYISESAILDISGTAFTKVKQVVGDPYDNEKWKELLSKKKVFMRGIYQRHIADMPYFTVVSRSDVNVI